MELDKLITKLLNAENSVITENILSNPMKMSRAMAEISMYANGVEEHLAGLEKEYESQVAQLLRRFMRDEKLSATAADKAVRIELGKTKGDIAYLTRIVGSAWRQTSALQSRINHVLQFSKTTDL